MFKLKPYLLWILGVWILGFFLASVPAFAQATASESDRGSKTKIQLRILYAGDPEAERSSEWLAFLRDPFTDVQLILVTDLSMATAKAFDVVVVDTPSSYVEVDGQPKKVYQEPASPKLDRSFSKPIVLVGEGGGNILSQMRRRQQGIKLDWH